MSGIALVPPARKARLCRYRLQTLRRHAIIRQLTRAGVKVHVGHEAATIDEVKARRGCCLHRYSESNPELIALASLYSRGGPVPLCFGPQWLHHRRC